MKETISCPAKLFSRKNVVCDAIEVEVCTGIDALNKVLWNSVLPDKKMLLQTDYLEAAEKANPHITFKYGIVYENGDLSGVALFQLIKVKNGLRIRESADQNFKTKFINLVKKGVNSVNVNLLLCGNAFITGDFGIYHKKTANKEFFIKGVMKAIEQIRKEERVNIVMVKDFRPENIEEGRLLTQFGFKEVRAQPSMEFDVRPEWENFADYLAALSSKYRTKLKSKRKKAKGLTKRLMTLEEIRENKANIYRMYKDCSDNAEFNLTFLTAEYFVACKEELGERFQVLGYFGEEGQLVSFLSWFEMDGMLESHFVGYERHLNNQFALYYNLLLDHVEFAIDRKMHHISFGRTALESKSNLGAVGVELNSFAWSSNMILQYYAVPLFDSMRDNTGFIPRNPFKEVKK